MDEFNKDLQEEQSTEQKTEAKEEISAVSDAVQPAAEVANNEECAATECTEKSEETSPAQEASPAQDDPSKWNDFFNIVREHHQAVKKLLAFNAKKDAGIAKLSAEIEKYRTNFNYNVVKNIASKLILFREDCRKAVRDCERFNRGAEGTLRNMGVISSQIDDLIFDLGFEQDGDAWLYNEKKLFVKESAAKPVVFDESEAAEPEDVPVPEIRNQETLTAYVKQVEEDIKKILANNDRLMQCLNAYINYAGEIEKNNASGIIEPVAKKIISLPQECNAKIEEQKALLNDENHLECYKNVMQFIADQCEDILFVAGIKSENMSGDDFDMKKMKIMRTIPTQDESLDKKVATVYTDCYSAEDKVIYQAKADVYVYKIQ